MDVFPAVSTLQKEMDALRATNKDLRAQVKGLEIILRQNAALEQEVTRLCKELDEATKGVLKRGFLYKWRDREISYAAKWGLRYFELSGKTLSYFADEHDHRPRRTIDLSQCIVRSDGTKKGGTYHVFCVYLASENLQMAESLLLRLSTESKSEASQWIAMLEQACAIAELDAEGRETWKENPSPTAHLPDAMGRPGRSAAGLAGDEQSVPSAAVQQQLEGEFDTNDWGNTVIDVDAALKDDGRAIAAVDDALDGMSPRMIQRVRSTNLILRKSQSRSLIARQILHKRAPTVFSSSGANLIERELAAKDRQGLGGKGSASLGVAGAGAGAGSHGAALVKIKSFPAFKPMHRESKTSPLSYDRGPGEQNYRGFFNLGVIILFLAHFRMAGENFTKYGLLPSLFGASSGVSTAAAAGAAGVAGGAGRRALKLAAAQAAAAAAAGGTASAAAAVSWVPAHAVEALLSWAVSILVAYWTERLAARGQISEAVVVFANVTACTLNLVVPILWVWFSHTPPMGAMVYLFQSVIIWMKLVSYAHANRDLRNALRTQKKNSEHLLASAGSAAALGGRSSLSLATVEDVNAKPPAMAAAFAEAKDLEPPFLSYPMNITLPNLLYFCLAPTLTYQLNFPRLPNIRWKHLATIWVRMGCVGAMMLFFWEQYMKPTLVNSVDPMRDQVRLRPAWNTPFPLRMSSIQARQPPLSDPMRGQDLVRILERLLKLSIPNTYVCSVP